MKIDDVRELWKAQPFEPFIIHTTDGRSFPVPHPDFLSIVGHGRKIVIDSMVNHSYSIVDPMLVTSLEVPNPDSSVSNSEASQKLS
jgi:hypothetical protein